MITFKFIFNFSSHPLLAAQIFDNIYSFGITHWTIFHSSDSIHERLQFTADSYFALEEPLKQMKWRESHPIVISAKDFFIL